MPSAGSSSMDPWARRASVSMPYALGLSGYQWPSGWLPLVRLMLLRQWKEHAYGSRRPEEIANVATQPATSLASPTRPTAVSSWLMETRRTMRGAIPCGGAKGSAKERSAPPVSARHATACGSRGRSGFWATSPLPTSQPRHRWRKAVPCCLLRHEFLFDEVMVALWLHYPSWSA